MTTWDQALQLALRERRRLVLLGGTWVLLTIVCTLTGPFGTHDVLSPWQRFGYWGVIVGASVISSVLPFMLRPNGAYKRFAAWSAYALGLTCVFFALDSVMFEGLGNARHFGFLLVNVSLIVLAVHFLIWLIDFARPAAPAVDFDPQPRFLRRVPLATRAPLVRIEAQDHYLNIVTTKGNALIMMRLSDAVDELEGADGLLVHRSHWVAVPAVQAHKRLKGRDLLVLSDGAQVPVSRSNKAAAQAAGLF
jgi:hypothetical protein